MIFLPCANQCSDVFFAGLGQWNFFFNFRFTCIKTWSKHVLKLEEMTTEELHDSENRMKNFQCLLEEINEEASIQIDQIKQLCETLPDDNDLSLNLEVEGVS